MKFPALSILTLSLLLTPIHAQPDQLRSNPDKYYWPMFHREPVVTLEGLEIPAPYKRTKITDTQGRSIDGEWLVIDRSKQVVKVRRARDKKEFEVPFKNLSEPDRRYAELETGKRWDTDETAPVPLDLIITAKTSLPLDIPPIHVRLGTLDDPAFDPNTAPPSKDPFASPPQIDQKLSTAEIIDGKQVRLTWRTPYTNEKIETADLPIDLLTQNDRALIKAHTGVELPPIPHQEWCPENQRYWRSIKHVQPDGKIFWNRPYFSLGKYLPQYEPGYVNETKDSRTGKVMMRVPLIRTTSGYMSRAFTFEEIFDHLRVKTLTSDFLFQEASYSLGQQEMQRKLHAPISPKPIAKSLEQVMEMLATKEPESEMVSLKTMIAATKVKLFEEPTPSEDPKAPKRIIPNTLPMDGQLQALHFIAQVQRVAAGKPKVPFATLFDNIQMETTSKVPTERPATVFFRDQAIHDVIAKYHNADIWELPEFFPTGLGGKLGKENLWQTIYWKLVRQQLRNKMLHLAIYSQEPGGKPSGYAILTGFTLTGGKEPIYEAILLEGSVLHSDAYSGQPKLPYTVREDTLPESKTTLDWGRTPFVSIKK